MVWSTHTDNTRIRNPDSRNYYIGNPDNQIQFRLPLFPLKLARQNAARERKRIHIPPMQLREAFSCIFPFLFVVVLRGVKGPAKDFPDAINMRLPLY